MKITEQDLTQLTSCEAMFGHLMKTNLYAIINLGRLTDEELFLDTFMHISHINSNLWNLILFAIQMSKGDMNVDEYYFKVIDQLKILIADFHEKAEKIKNMKLQ